MQRVTFVVLCWLLTLSAFGQASSGEHWGAATPAQLEAALPARATVEKEHIETEMRTANGLINARGQMIAVVVLITAGYASDGKYSHYLLVQSPMLLAGSLLLKPGSYVVGWRRVDDSLEVHFFDSLTGVERGSEVARLDPLKGHVESFHIWPPNEHKGIQIGRFYIPYSLP